MTILCGHPQLAVARARLALRGTRSPPLRPQPQGVADPVGQPRLHAGLVQVLQGLLYQGFTRRVLQALALLRREQRLAPGLVKIQRRLHGGLLRQWVFAQRRSLLGQSLAKHLRGLAAVGPLCRAQQHHDLARQLLGQLLRGLRYIGGLFIERQQRQNIGVDAVLLPKAPLVCCHGQHHYQPGQRGQPPPTAWAGGSADVGGGCTHGCARTSIKKRSILRTQCLLCRGILYLNLAAVAARFLQQYLLHKLLTTQVHGLQPLRQHGVARHQVQLPA